MPSMTGRAGGFGGRTGGVSGGRGGATGGTGGAAGFDARRMLGGDTLNPITGERISPEKHADMNKRDINRGRNKKGTAGQDPRPDLLMKKQAAVDQKPVMEVQKAVIEATRQRRLQDPALDIAQTILGALPTPAPMGVIFGLGRWMGKKVEEDAMENPERYTTIPGDPGGIRSVKGPASSNRALPGNAAKKTQASVDDDDRERRRKKTLPTLLGTTPSPLGTPNNPMMIT